MNCKVILFIWRCIFESIVVEMFYLMACDFLFYISIWIWENNSMQNPNKVRLWNMKQSFSLRNYLEYMLTSNDVKSP